MPADLLHVWETLRKLFEGRRTLQVRRGHTEAGRAPHKEKVKVEQKLELFFSDLI